MQLNLQHTVRVEGAGSEGNQEHHVCLGYSTNMCAPMQTYWEKNALKDACLIRTYLCGGIVTQTTAGTGRTLQMLVQSVGSQTLLTTEL